jgi:hypothetical protein
MVDRMAKVNALRDCPLRGPDPHRPCAKKRARHIKRSNSVNPWRGFRWSERTPSILDRAFKGEL